MKIPTIAKLLSTEIFKFILIGIISAALEFSLLLLLVEQGAIDYRWANIMAFSLTNVFTFLTSRRFVFVSANTNKTSEAALFAACLLGGLALNQMVLWGLVEFTSIDYRFAKVIAIGVTVIWNFFTRKHLVFKNRQVATQGSPSSDYGSNTF